MRTKLVYYDNKKRYFGANANKISLLRRLYGEFKNN